MATFGTTTISVEVPRPVTDWEYDDIKQAVEHIMKAESFFYAGDGELGDEIRAFLVDHPIDSNLEFAEDGDAVGS